MNSILTDFLRERLKKENFTKNGKSKTCIERIFKKKTAIANRVMMVHLYNLNFLNQSSLSILLLHFSFFDWS